MRSVDDLTAARIRDAALAVFAREGFHRATVRGIAAEAGVSAALVIHHFGSKDALREACDRHVLATAAGEKQAIIARGFGPDVDTYLADHPEVAAQLAYLARAVTEGGELCDRWFDSLVEHTDAVLAAGAASGTFTPSADPHARTVVLVAQSLATLVFARQIARHFGAADLNDPDAYARLGRAVLELSTHGLLSDSGSRSSHD